MAQNKRTIELAASAVIWPDLASDFGPVLVRIEILAYVGVEAPSTCTERSSEVPNSGRQHSTWQCPTKT